MMKIYDKDGNEVVLKSQYRQNLKVDALEQIDLDSAYMEIVKARNDQLRLTPGIWWTLVGLDVTFGVAMIPSFIMGIITMSWAPVFLGVFFLICFIGLMFGLGLYHDSHGMPKRFKEEPKVRYCTKCQTKLENDLEIAKKQRLAEAMATIRELSEQGVPVPELEARINKATTEQMEAAERYAVFQVNGEDVVRCNGQDPQAIWNHEFGYIKRWEWTPPEGVDIGHKSH